MDLKELKKQVDKITLELKNKASDELSPLIESQSVLINVILEMSTGILAQNEWLTATITDLQENIKELRRQYPLSNIVAIDYDPGASEVNQLNRIKLMLSTAQKNLKKGEGVE